MKNKLIVALIGFTLLTGFAPESSGTGITITDAFEVVYTYKDFWGNEQKEYVIQICYTLPKQVYRGMVVEYNQEGTLPKKGKAKVYSVPSQITQAANNRYGYTSWPILKNQPKNRDELCK